MNEQQATSYAEKVWRPTSLGPLQGLAMAVVVPRQLVGRQMNWELHKDLLATKLEALASKNPQEALETLQELGLAGADQMSPEEMALLAVDELRPAVDWEQEDLQPKVDPELLVQMLDQPFSEVIRELASG